MNICNQEVIWICILEGSWIGDRTSRALRYADMKISPSATMYHLLTFKDSSTTCSVEGMNLSICSKMNEIDYLINVPVLKGHCQTNITCALKNMKGCIPNSEKKISYHGSS